MEEEFIRNQEQMKPLEEKQEEERSKVDDLRGTPMSVGTLEEIIDDNHAIVSTSVGSEHYVSILSFVDKDLLEPGCSVLLNHKVHAVIGVLMDDTDPLVTVMKVEKAPQETYADIGGLDNQIQEIKVFLGTGAGFRLRVSCCCPPESTRGSSACFVFFTDQTSNSAPASVVSPVCEP
ncbi:proteasome 26S subunit, ATPase 1 [Phyllostomus discolor]|uniref:Proteasome 26S subunit, ATPase 1 n=1 Tax=Phyllostomus discolor TaxID=89673 RepID=A0A834EZM5_9CHIR|nr:proteasome 26S subunit, ATPase 1 [Phyllostomus discolor]